MSIKYNNKLIKRINELIEYITSSNITRNKRVILQNACTAKAEALKMREYANKEDKIMSLYTISGCLQQIIHKTIIKSIIDLAAKIIYSINHYRLKIINTLNYKEEETEEEDTITRRFRFMCKLAE